MFNGISFSDISLENLSEDDNIYKLSKIEENIFAEKFNYTGFYFLHVLNKDKLITIYCGQSLGNTDGIKGRLKDHLKKFYLDNKWKQWRKDNENDIDKYYFSTFENDYGPAYENFIIYFKVVNIKFHLNTTLNDNKKLLNIKELIYKNPSWDIFTYNILEGGNTFRLIQNVALSIKYLLHGSGMEID